MRKQDSTKQRRKPVHLRPCDLQTIYTIYNALDKPDGYINLDLPDRIAQQIRSLVRRLSKIAGTTARKPTWRDEFETAIREVRRGEVQRGEDPTEAYKIADKITALLKRHGREHGAQHNTRKGTRRIPVTIKWLRWSGILRGDKATVAMNGDVRVGELGYFSIWHYGQAYKQLRFVYEQDDRCRRSHPSTYTPGGICLRERRGIDGRFHECTGNHDGLAYGRVCAVERDGQPVETKLDLRPYDEREGPATTRLNENASPQIAREEVRSERTPPVIAPRRLATQMLKTNLFAGFGLIEGDELIYEETPTEELLPGELVWFISKGSQYLARFVSLDEDALTVATSSGEEYESNPADVSSVKHVVSYTRTVLLRSDPTNDAAPTDSPAQVIDLNVYRQAHPQRIRNLLFAEKQ
jgi:hypothetical protein